MADCFIKLHDINGESGDEAYINYIQVTSWEWGFGKRHSQVTSIENIDGKPVAQYTEERTLSMGVSSPSNLSFVHPVDSASPVLLNRCASNYNIKTGELIMRRAGGLRAQLYLKISLENVRVLRVSLLHDAQHIIPSERVELAFDRITYEYTTQSSQGSNKSGTIVFDWRRPN